MQTDSSDLKKMRPLVDHELDAVSGGFVHTGVVGGSFPAGKGIRMDMHKITFPLRHR